MTDEPTPRHAAEPANPECAQQGLINEAPAKAKSVDLKPNDEASARPQEHTREGDGHRRRPAGRVRRMFTGRYRWWTRAAIVLLVLVLAVGIDIALVAGRIHHVDVALPQPGPGTTYVVVGSDSRADLPPGADPNGFGGTVEVPGQRADVVLVVHVTPDGPTTTLSIPRDLLVRGNSGGFSRLTLTLRDGPQDLVDSLCRTLGIRTDHLIMVDFRGFTEVVDTIGGVSVTIPYPVRDRWSGLSLDRAGPQTLTGAQALALVRSRHPEELRNGTWTPVADGAGQRTAWAGVVFDAIRQGAGRAKTNPVLLQRLAWVGAGVLTTDHNTGIFDLASLAQVTGKPIDLPAAAVTGAALGLQTSDKTFAVLAAAGFDRSCLR